MMIYNDWTIAYQAAILLYRISVLLTDLVFDSLEVLLILKNIDFRGDNYTTEV